MTSLTESRNNGTLGEDVRGSRLLLEQSETVSNSGRELAVPPLIDQVAHGFARALLIAINELETRIANENRKLGDMVGDRLGSLQLSFEELTARVSEQQAESRVLQDRCQTLEAAIVSLKESDTREEEQLLAVRNDLSAKTASISSLVESSVTLLREADARQETELASVRDLLKAETAALRDCDASQASDIARDKTETQAAVESLRERISELLNEIAVQQEDIVAIQSTIQEFGSRFDLVLHRVEKQGEALHTMYTTYAQRESELERVIEGLTRLRAVPAPPATPRL
jgi:chromosome segregation ATPase